MEKYIKQLDIRWSDLDPNFHLRHSVYYDWGAYCRMCFFTESGLSTQVLQDHQVGPILLREECVFRREVKFGDAITINLEITRAKTDFSRWSIQHQVFKNDKELSAVLKVDGAWIDTEKRKLTLPPPVATEVFRKMPPSPEFEWINK